MQSRLLRHVHKSNGKRPPGGSFFGNGNGIMCRNSLAKANYTRCNCKQSRPILHPIQVHFLLMLIIYAGDALSPCRLKLRKSAEVKSTIKLGKFGRKALDLLFQL